MNFADNKVSLNLGLIYLETDPKTTLRLSGNNLETTQKHLETN